MINEQHIQVHENMTWHYSLEGCGISCLFCEYQHFRGTWWKKRR